MRIAALITAGSPTEADYKEALERCESAASNKLSAGATCAGRIYERGLGRPADAAEALKWYRRGAELGSAMSRLYLGEMYRDGRGVKPDKTEAYMWLMLAEAASIPEAKQEEAALHGELSKKEIEKAQQSALLWSRQHEYVGLVNRSPRD